MSERLKIAASADFHISTNITDYVFKKYQEIVEKMSNEGDILVIAGDFTRFGTPEEAMIVSKIFSLATKPIIGVLGNHDFVSDNLNLLVNILKEEGGVKILQGDSYKVKVGERDVELIGVIGCGGGFLGDHDFRVEEPLELAKLNRALEQTTSENIVVITHYSPVKETLEGERYELYSSLGSSMLEEIIDSSNKRVKAIIHGHSHHGYPEGWTKGGKPVFNVALSVLQNWKENSYFRIIEV